MATKAPGFCKRVISHDISSIAHQHSPLSSGVGCWMAREQSSGLSPFKNPHGSKIHSESSRKHSWPFFYHFFFLGFPLYMFPFTCALLLFIITTQGPAAAAGPSSSCLGGCCPRAVLNIIIFHIMLFQSFEGIRIGATISARQQRKSFFLFLFEALD